MGIVSERSELATPAEAAQYLRSSVNGIKQMRYRGVGPRYIRRGRRVLYSWADLEAYVRENTVCTSDNTPGAA